MTDMTEIEHRARQRALADRQRVEEDLDDAAEVDPRRHGDTGPRALRDVRSPLERQADEAHNRLLELETAEGEPWASGVDAITEIRARAFKAARGQGRALGKLTRRMDAMIDGMTEGFRQAAADLAEEYGPIDDDRPVDPFAEPLELADLSVELVDALNDLGDHYGPLGVALAAAHLTDERVLVERIRARNRRGISRDELAASEAPAALEALVTALDLMGARNRVRITWPADVEAARHHAEELLEILDEDNGPEEVVSPAAAREALLLELAATLEELTLSIRRETDSIAPSSDLTYALQRADGLLEAIAAGDTTSPTGDTHA